MGGRRHDDGWTNSPANLTLLCGSGVTGCHGLVEVDERAAAKELGLLIGQGVRTPDQVPMWTRIGWVWLDVAGGKSLLPAPPEFDAELAGRLWVKLPRTH